ncbi:MAG TPA: hypothetical protein VHT93_01585 [Pseudolabrys sp.]|nr:hypothetical protein [Pseudolabrys sp.]
MTYLAFTVKSMSISICASDERFCIPTTAFLWSSHMKTAWMVACVLSISLLPTVINAQGVIGGAQQGANQGARQGSKAAGPVGGAVGGVVGGTVGGVTGGVKGALGVPSKPNSKPKAKTTN